MDFHKLTTEELRGYDAAKLRETESGIRRAMVDIRMDIYTARNQHTAKIRGLRKSLARLLTVRGRPVTAAKGVAKAEKPAAATKAKAEKPAKAKAPKAAKEAAAKPAATKAKKPSTKK